MNKGKMKKGKKQEPQPEPAVDYSSAKYTLNNGTEMPVIGAGTCKIRNKTEVIQTVDFALAAGYRMFDTTSMFGSEGSLGEAIKILLPKYGLQREDIFLTTKLTPLQQHGKINVENCVSKSLSNLGLDYIDLYLLDLPMRLLDDSPRNQKLRIAAWQDMEQVYNDGKVHAIGVCNFCETNLDQLLANSGTVPAVNQVEWAPLHYHIELIEYCKQQDIVFQQTFWFEDENSIVAYYLDFYSVTSISKQLEATPAQTMLTWALQKDIAVIPKSTNKDTINENISLHFKLSENQMKKLNSIGKK